MIVPMEFAFSRADSFPDHFPIKSLCRDRNCVEGIALKFQTPLLFLFSMVLGASLVTTQASAHEVADAMAEAANQFLGSLEDPQKAKASIDLQDEERRNWHYIPKPFEGPGMRHGLPLMEMRDDLLKSLDEERRKLAVISDKEPKDVIAPIEPKINPLEGLGVVAEKMNATQQQMLRSLIEKYVRWLRPVPADADLKKIDAACFGKILFVWAGALDKGQGNYYRVQGPTVLLEYSNTENDANHAHAAWRDFDGDFGMDVLKEHYSKNKH